MKSLNTSSLLVSSAKANLANFIAPILPVRSKVSYWLAHNVASLCMPVIVPGSDINKIEETTSDDSGIDVKEPCPSSSSISSSDQTCDSTSIMIESLENQMLTKISGKVIEKIIESVSLNCDKSSNCEELTNLKIKVADLEDSVKKLTELSERSLQTSNILVTGLLSDLNNLEKNNVELSAKLETLSTEVSLLKENSATVKCTKLQMNASNYVDFGSVNQDEPFAVNHDIEVAQVEPSTIDKSVLRIEGLLDKSNNELSNLIVANKLTDVLSKFDVISIRNTVYTQMKTQKLDFERLVEKYENFPNNVRSMEKLERADATLEKVDKWITDFNILFENLGGNAEPIRSELLCHKLEKFTENCDISIFEFINKFEVFVCSGFESKIARAFLLYENYLDTVIQEKTFDLRENYDKLIARLKEMYGKPVDIVNNILNRVMKLNPPTQNKSNRSKADYFIILEATMKKLDALWNYNGMNVRRLEEWLYSTTVIETILDRIPNEKHGDIYKDLDMCGFDILDLHGKGVFDLIRSHIKSYTRIADGLLRLDSKGYKCRERKDNVMKRSIHRKCPIPGPNHRHSLLDCKQFLEARPENKRSFGYGSICYVCLGPYSVCKVSCQNDVPSKLICQACKVKSPNTSAPLILMCPEPDHHKGLNESDVLACLKDEFPGLRVDTLDKKALLGVNY